MTGKADHVAVARLLAGTMPAADAHEFDRDAAIVHLHTVEGMSAAAIAWRLGVNSGVPERVLVEHAEREARRAAWRARYHGEAVSDRNDAA